MAKGLLIVVLILLAIAGGWWAFTYYTGYEIIFGPPDVAPAVAEASQLPVTATPTTLAITHSVQGSTHTYSGTLTLPACEQLSSGVQVVGIEAPEVDLLLEGAVVSGCTDTTQISQDFSVSVGVTSGTPVFGKVFFNGAEVPHSLSER